mmetsp:Transcript_139558/g.389257  ORF Transcript_139558/g.389257 Transcript_139558/m.389257 type:complete len:343 (+) Transcript_139558:81-1109(+)
MLCCQSQSQPEAEVVPELVEGTPAPHAAQVRALFGEPSGKFLKGTHGITHFVEEGNGSKLAVLAHGLGTNWRAYRSCVDAFQEAGFRVVRYSYYGHGWSYMNPGVIPDLSVLLLQLKQLLDHLLEPGEPLDLFVGHSTGGVLGVKAATNIGRRVLRLALVSPAFWKNAPCAAKLADSFPSLIRWIASFQVGLIENTYLKNNDVAFAHEKDDTTGQTRYLYPEAYEAAKESIDRKWDLHPQINDAVAGRSTTVLRDDMLREERSTFKSLLSKQGPEIPVIGLFWGTYDVVVDFGHSNEVVSWPGGDAVTLVPLTGMGHESLFEDGPRVAMEIAKWASNGGATA